MVLDIKKAQEIFQASGNDEIPKAIKLVDSKEEANAKTPWKETILMRACSKGQIELVKHLIAKGADVNVQDENGSTALINACGSSFPGEEDDKEVMTKKLECAKLLVKAGVKINAQNNLGFSALSFAASLALEDICEFLLKNNADPNILDKQGMSALMWAAGNQSEKVVKLLLNAKAKKDIKSISGKTAYDVAIEANQKKIALLLKK